MTVCVAAISNGGMVVGASDRMLTAGDIEFEPPQSKVLPLTTSITMMYAGNSSLQASLLQSVSSDVQARIEAAPTNWWKVADVAGLYRRHYLDAANEMAESQILAPLGLSHSTFVSRQRDLAPEIAIRITNELLSFQAPQVAAIFSGVDETGPHIYVCRGASVQCSDIVGFAAIGMGEYHAASELMVEKHTRMTPLPETLLTVYAAKRRAETAPGVGSESNMFIIGPQLGSYVELREDVMAALERIWRTAQRAMRTGRRKARTGVNAYLQALAVQAAEAASAAEQTPPAPERSATEEPEGGDGSGEVPRTGPESA